MAEYYACEFGGTEVMTRIDSNIPVQCPVCGSIRKIPMNRVWSDMFVYPAHSQPETLRTTRCYKRMDNGAWKIVNWMPKEEMWCPELEK